MLKSKWMGTALAVTILGGGTVATSHVFAAVGANSLSVVTDQMTKAAAVANDQNQTDDQEVADDQNQTDDQEVADDQNQTDDQEVADDQNQTDDQEVADDQNSTQK